MMIKSSTVGATICLPTTVHRINDAICELSLVLLNTAAYTFTVTAVSHVMKIRHSE